MRINVPLFFRQALIGKIRDGTMGSIELIRACRMDPGARMGPFPGGQSTLFWQIGWMEI